MELAAGGAASATREGYDAMGGTQSGEMSGYDTSMGKQSWGAGYAQLEDEQLSSAERKKEKEKQLPAGKNEVAGAVASSGGMEETMHSSVGGRRILSVTVSSTAG